MGLRDLSEFKCLLFGSDTLWCTEFCRKIGERWIVGLSGEREGVLSEASIVEE